MGKAHTESATAWPISVDWHQRKNGSSMGGAYSVTASQPASQLTQPGWGWMSQSNQL